MIWNDPWLLAALAPGGTRLPPMQVVLGKEQRFEMFSPRTLQPYLEAWIALVGTRWLQKQVLERLEYLKGAWIPCLFQGNELVATCVLQPKDIWILETLHARKGFGAPLLRSLVVWLYKRVGPFSLGYTWELSPIGLLGAWSRGWLASAVAIQYGWSWSHSCSFCSSHPEARFTVPVAITTANGMAIVSDSGLRDGWGHVLTYRGNPDWAMIAKEGSWASLWTRSRGSPGLNWSWTGEFVVVGILNQIYEGSPNIDWITAEI